MGLFDKSKNNPAPAVQSVQTSTNKSVKITFAALSETLEAFKRFLRQGWKRPLQQRHLLFLHSASIPKIRI